MPICDFGCGKESTHQFKNGKYCCSPNVNACEGKCQKDREKKKGKNPWLNKEHPRGMLGKHSWNAGKTYIELYGEEKAHELCEAHSRRLIGHNNFSKVDQETLDRIKKEASDRAYKRHAAGWQGAIGRCKKIKYSSLIAGEVMLDGGWELLVAQYLDSINVQWERNKKRFKYFFEGKERFYTPDFYVSEWNSYIEVKGYETDLDKCKWDQFTEILLVWKKEKIKEIKKILNNK